jgi:hypothetical protein
MFILKLIKNGEPLYVYNRLSVNRYGQVNLSRLYNLTDAKAMAAELDAKQAESAMTQLVRIFGSDILNHMELERVA